MYTIALTGWELHLLTVWFWSEELVFTSIFLLSRPTSCWYQIIYNYFNKRFCYATAVSLTETLLLDSDWDSLPACTWAALISSFCRTLFLIIHFILPVQSHWRAYSCIAIMEGRTSSGEYFWWCCTSQNEHSFTFRSYTGSEGWQLKNKFLLANCSRAPLYNQCKNIWFLIGLSL